METRYVIARLRALSSRLDHEAFKANDLATAEKSTSAASVLDGRCLAYTRAAMLVRELAQELAAEEMRRR